MRGKKTKKLRKLSKFLAAQRNLPWENRVVHEGKIVLVPALVGPPKPFKITGTSRLVKCGKSIYRTMKSKYKKKEIYI